jgi:hypothetical protein
MTPSNRYPAVREYSDIIEKIGATSFSRPQISQRSFSRLQVSQLNNNTYPTSLLKLTITKLKSRSQESRYGKLQIHCYGREKDVAPKNAFCPQLN